MSEFEHTDETMSPFLVASVTLFSGLAVALVVWGSL
jgi:hypothetical protein